MRYSSPEISTGRGDAMPTILLINPNSSQATTAMMVAMAQAAAGGAAEVRGVTAADGPGMITTAAALAASVAGVVEIGMRDGPAVSGVIVGAFGDPGAEILRERLSVPVTGICAAAMLEAAGTGTGPGRRFAVATTTPDLVAAIDARAATLGLAALYAGTWLTPEDPFELVADPQRLERALGHAVERAIREGGAEAVIIGGGPLSAAAAALAEVFPQPIVAPVAAAVRRLLSAGLSRRDGHVR